VAACAASRITPEGIKILKDRGIRLLKVSGTKDAADEALLAEARRAAAGGCHRFFVASNDSRFGQIADLGQLEIVIWQSQKPRVKDYSSRAAKVHRLPIPGARPIPGPGRPMPASRPAPTAPRAIKGAPPRAPAAPGTGRPARQEAAAPRPSAAQLAAIGIGVLATGMLFGAGTVTGAVAARRLLRWADSASGHSSGT
jgi:hypothetical protein